MTFIGKVKEGGNERKNRTDDMLQDNLD